MEGGGVTYNFESVATKGRFSSIFFKQKILMWFLIICRIGINWMKKKFTEIHGRYVELIIATISKEDNPRTIPAKFGLIWLSCFYQEDTNVIFNSNMINFQHQYKSAERKISQKNPKYMINYSLTCRCSSNLSLFWLIIKQQ